MNLRNRLCVVEAIAIGLLSRCKIEWEKPRDREGISTTEVNGFQR
jgi:hypothetical protein